MAPLRARPDIFGRGRIARGQVSCRNGTDTACSIVRDSGTVQYRVEGPGLVVVEEYCSE